MWDRNSWIRAEVFYSGGRWSTCVPRPEYRLPRCILIICGNSWHGHFIISKRILRNWRIFLVTAVLMLPESISRQPVRSTGAKWADRGRSFSKWIKENHIIYIMWNHALSYGMYQIWAMLFGHENSPPDFSILFWTIIGGYCHAYFWDALNAISCFDFFDILAWFLPPPDV